MSCEIVAANIVAPLYRPPCSPPSSPPPLTAQTPGAFAGKTVTMYIGFGPGGGYDLWARVVARHIGAHLPGNPTVNAQNLEGAGSYRAANFIYNVAPKDGTAMALIARDAVLGPLTGAPGAQFDATKFSWLGTPAIETNVCIAYHTSPVKTAQDLTQKELVVGDNGPGTGTHSYPIALNNYSRHEIPHRRRLSRRRPTCFSPWSAARCRAFAKASTASRLRQPTWIPNGTISLLFQGGTKPNPEIKDVPFVVDLAQKPEDKQAIEFLYAGQGIGRPFVAPPGLPPDRLKMVQDAFAATMKDPDFIAETKLRKLNLDPRERRAARSAGQEDLRHAEADHRPDREIDSVRALFQR